MAHPPNTQLMGPKVSLVPSPPPCLLTLVPFSWLTSCYNFCQQATVLLPKSAPCPQRLGWGGECFSFILQIVPMEPTEYSKQPENPIIHGESLQQPSSEDNRALITARLTLLNCAHEQKKSMRQTQTLARGHGKTWEHSMAWPPECRLSFTPSLWWDFFFTTSFFFFLAVPLLGEWRSPAARSQNVYGLTEQSMETAQFPFLYMAMREPTPSSACRELSLGWALCRAWWQWLNLMMVSQLGQVERCPLKLLVVLSWHLSSTYCSQQGKLLVVNPAAIPAETTPGLSSPRAELQQCASSTFPSA